MSKTGMMAAVAAAAGLSAEAPVEITAATIAEHFPAIATELRGEGAKAERERILGIEKAGLPGHEKIIAAHKADPAKTPADAAFAVLEAEKSSRGNQLKALDTDEQSVKGLRSEPANGTEKPANPLAGLSGEALWKAEFAGSADLQAEFTNEASYVAFKRADSKGLARILNKKSA